MPRKKDYELSEFDQNIFAIAHNAKLIELAELQGFRSKGLWNKINGHLSEIEKCLDKAQKLHQKARPK